MRCPILVALVASAAAGCASPPHDAGAEPGAKKVRTLYSSSICDTSVTGARATWIDGPEAFEAAFRRVRGHVIGGDSERHPPAVDFDRFGVVLVESGRQSTGGHGLRLAERRLRLQEDRAVITVENITPEAGRIQTQVVTSPCLFAAVPRAHFRQVVIVDRNGNTLARAKAEEPAKPGR